MRMAAKLSACNVSTSLMLLKHDRLFSNLWTTTGSVRLKKNAPKLKIMVSPKVLIEDDFSPGVQFYRKKLRDFAISNRGSSRLRLTHDRLKLNNTVSTYISNIDPLVCISTANLPDFSTWPKNISNSSPTKKFGSLSFLTVNFRSRLPKQNELLSCSHACSADVVLNTETWLTSDIANKELSFV